MRNLKKLLSVVLVVAMIASLCAVGSFSAAAAEYSEATNYKQAAAVVSGIGIIEGYEDGTMKYDKAVTREEAAKIICVALVGSDTVANLKTAAAPFADVAANRWSAPYISYLKAQGIVNGKTATQFDPTAEVTAVEFAKMMLCAAGYGKAGEFVGASWDVNTIATANTYGVFDNTLATDLTAPATREQCMLYTFNAITRVPTVSFNTTFQSYYTGTSVMNGSGSKVTDANVGNAANADYKATLAYSKFKLVKTVDGIDDYGRPAATWAFEGGKVISNAVESQVPTYTLKGAVTNATIYNTLGAAISKNLNKQIWNDATSAITPNADNVFEVYKNGVKLTGASYPLNAALAGNSLTKNMVSGGGDTVEIYVDNVTAAEVAANTVTANSVAGDYKVRFVITSEYFGQVTAVSANQLTVNVKLTNSMTGANNNFDVTVKADDVNITGYAKKDYVLLNISNPATTKLVTSIAHAKDAVVGTYQGSNSMFQNKIDGSYIGSSTVSGVPGGLLVAGSQFSFWYDSMGNVIFAELYKDSAVVDMNKYVYVKNTHYIEDSRYDFAFEVQAVYSDGNVEWVNYTVDPNTGAFKFNGATYYLGYSGVNLKVYTDAAKNTLLGTGSNKIEDLIGKTFYTFTKDSDNKVVLKNIDNDFATIVTTAVVLNSRTGYSVNNALGTSCSTDSTTNVAIVDGAKNVIKMNGESKFNDKTYTGTTLITYAKGKSTIKGIFVYTTVAGALDTKSYAYVINAVEKDADYGYINMIVDGNMVTNAKVDITDYNTVSDFWVRGTGKVYEVTLSGDVYDLVALANNAPGTGNFATNERIINNSNALATSTNLGAYGYMNGDTFAYDYHYAWATIESVDNHSFWTATADANTNEAGDKNGAAAVASAKYYFDSNTKIYDTTAGGAAGQLESGKYFIAITNTNAAFDSANSNYCEYIWIVG